MSLEDSLDIKLPVWACIILCWHIFPTQMFGENFIYKVGSWAGKGKVSNPTIILLVSFHSDELMSSSSSSS